MNRRPCSAGPANAAPLPVHTLQQMLRSSTKSGVQTESLHARLNSSRSRTAHCRQDQVPRGWCGPEP
ncbi:hypothetical protein AB9K35_00325 [Leisingera sp. XS_AS12]